MLHKVKSQSNKLCMISLPFAISARPSPLALIGMDLVKPVMTLVPSQFEELILYMVWPFQRPQIHPHTLQHIEHPATNISIILNHQNSRQEPIYSAVQ